MKRERKRLIEFLQLCGVVDVEDTPVVEDQFYKNDTTASRAIFLRHADVAKHAAEIVSRYAPQKKSPLDFLRGSSVLSVEQNEAFCERRDHVLRTAQRMVQLEKEIEDNEAEILRNEVKLEALLPWKALPVPQRFSRTKRTAVFIGSIEGEKTGESLTNLLAEAVSTPEAVHVEIVSQSPEQTNFYAIVLKASAAQAEEALRKKGFTRPTSTSDLSPIEEQELLLEQQKAARARIDACATELREASGQLGELLLLEDYMRMRAEKYEALAKLLESDHVFFLEGYVPQQAADELCEKLSHQFRCVCETAPAEQSDEKVPVLLKNNWFSQPTESVLESYAMPGAGDLDPTGIMAIFYYIMFGLMFSDAGYGLILAAVTGFVLLRFKNIEHGLKMFLQMFFWCGLSTIVWGIVFSSYFGDIADSVAVTFFGRAADAPPLIPPLWFSPLEEPMWLLMFCLGLGVLHLTAGYVMNGAANYRRGDFSAILYDAVFPITLIYPLIVILMGTEIFEGMLGFSVYTLPALATNICLVLAGASALGIILFGGRESKSWGKRLLKGLYALYNTGAGWLSDILSYSRLLALGLATGVIASVMNQLGGLAGGGIFGAILFIVVFAVGQTLNFGINVLGAYVHSNRLEFVEFFGKFYEGGGRKFSPLAAHTKHYKIREET